MKPGCKVGNGTVPDSAQVGVEWLDLGRLSEYRVYPKTLASLVLAHGELSERIYLGDVN